MPDGVRDVLYGLLVAELSRWHMGRDRGISAAALAARLQISERMLRTLISHAREDGIAVAGTPETGYFVARTAAELEECCALLRSRAMRSLAIESRLRQIPLPELLGQLTLRT